MFGKNNYYKNTIDDIKEKAKDAFFIIKKSDEELIKLDENEMLKYLQQLLVVKQILEK